MSAEIYIGTQGWNYEGWKGAFYPPRIPAKDYLKLFARIFNTVEIDSTFYAIPPEATVQGWYEKTPAGFKFALKLPSEITHKNRLRDSEKILLEFTARLLLLKEKLGCVLIQLPPDFHPAEHQALSKFLKMLPEEIKFAFEFRDKDWIRRSLLEEIEGQRAAVALIDGKWLDRELSFKMLGHQKASFAYVRWLGPRELTDFSKIQIERSTEFAQWAAAFDTLKQKTSEIFGYFNNHYQGHSPASANLFKSLIGLPTTSPSELITQPSLF